jgi:hypothetical protein
VHLCIGGFYVISVYETSSVVFTPCLVYVVFVDVHLNCIVFVKFFHSISFALDKFHV